MIEVREKVIKYSVDCPYCDNGLNFEKEDERGVVDLYCLGDFKKEKDLEKIRIIICPVCENVIKTRNQYGKRYKYVHPITIRSDY